MTARSHRECVPLSGYLVFRTEQGRYSLCMEVQSDRVEISVRLLTNGRYTWVITGNFPTSEAQGSIDILKSLDGTLRDKFPNHVQVGSGKISSWEE